MKQSHGFPRVLMFGWEFPPYNSGGLGTACLGLTKALIKNGVGIVFVLPKKMNIRAGFMKMVFGDCDCVAIDSPLTPYITSSVYSKEFGGAVIYGANLFQEVARYGEQAARIAKQEKFDVIHAHDWLTILAGLRAREVSGKPLVVHVHATEFDRTGGNGLNQCVYEIERRGVMEADRVVAVSGFTKNILVNHYGVSPDKVEVVHNGVDADDYQDEISISDKLTGLKSAGYKIVLFVGRITIQKGPDYFLRAAKKALEFDNKLIFIMGGSGDMERQMIEEAASLGIADRVLFTGFLRGSERIAMFKEADLFVMPSISEPFGLLPLEVLLFGTPVLISKQSGVSEVLTHALKVDFWDIDETVNMILAVVNNNVLQRQLGDEGQKEARGRDWLRAAKSCINIYNYLIAAQKN